VLEPDDEPSGANPDAHSMELRNVLAFVDQLGSKPPRTLIVGCEPASTDPGMGLSTVAAATIDRAVELVRNLCVESLV
jgi:hydrogenase maturation protease